MSNWVQEQNELYKENLMDKKKQDNINNWPIGMEVESIEVIDFYFCHIPKGSKGIVKGHNFTGNPLVEFYENVGGSGGVENKECKNGHGWWMWPSNLKVIGEFKALLGTENDEEFRVYGERIK